MALKKILEMSLAVLATFTSLTAIAEKVTITGDASRYEYYEGQVYDRQTNISWMRCSFGQQWRAPNKCIGKPKGFTFSQAQKLPERNPGWRLPSPIELATILRGELKTFDAYAVVPIPKINREAFPDMDPSRLFYWTNEDMSFTNAWFADFEYGSLGFVLGDYGFLDQKFAVRLMHTGSFWIMRKSKAGKKFPSNKTLRLKNGF